MKVLFVTRGWPTKANPMAGNYEAVQAKALAKRGVDVSVAVLQRRSLFHILSRRKLKVFKEDGVTVLTMPVVLFTLPKLFSWEQSRLNLWLKQRAFQKIYRQFREKYGNADLLHAHIVGRAHDCKKVIEEYHVPLVITEHWSKLNFSAVDSWMIRLSEAYRWAAKVICVSKPLSDSLKKKFDIDSVVVNNMVSDHFFNGETSGDHVGKVRFVSVGALLVRKGFDILISAFAKMKHLDKCQLIIIGSGDEKDNLQKLISTNNLNEKVLLLGRKKTEEVSDLIAESDCFVLSSRKETFGIVCIEAMAKGKPVIATICGGPESFISKDCGMLIPAEDKDAMTRAMDDMVENLSQYDSNYIRHYCLDNFSEEAISKKIIAVYKDVLEQHK